MRRCKEDDSEPNIRFYTKLQMPVVNYALLESLCKKRSAILRNIESHPTANINLTAADGYGKVTSVKKGDYSAINTNSRFIETAEEDVVSHFALKLVSAQNMASLKWFVRYESAFFMKRIEELKGNVLDEYFFKNFIYHLTNVQVADKTITIPYNSEYAIEQFKYPIKQDYKLNVHFSKVNDVISDDFPVEGYVMNARSRIKSCLLNFFRDYQEKTAYSLYFHLKNNPDERIQHLHDAIFIRQPKGQTASLKAVEPFFPPCVTGLIKKLKTLNHLKYKDRLILTRFMKDSGIPVEETVAFFRSNFKVPELTFKNKYLYPIRHSYGLEGKRANYSSYDCKRVIESHDNDTFGCPFKSNKAYLQVYGKEKSVDIEELGDCQMSCSKVLEKVSGRTVSMPITKPIEFMKFYSKKEEK